MSTSGNSVNVINAVLEAKKLSMKSFGLLGKTGGDLRDKCDHSIIVPGDTADRIQEIHMMILHIVIEGVERNLFPDLY